MKQEELLCEDNCLHTELIETSKKNVPDDDTLITLSELFKIALDHINED